MIRKRVFECYGVRTTVELDDVTKSFIFDLKETVLNHELGHGVIQYHLLSPDVAPIAEASKMCGESVITALLEVLADFAPWLGDVKGPLQNMVDVSLTDYDRAEEHRHGESVVLDRRDHRISHVPRVVADVAQHGQSTTGIVGGVEVGGDGPLPEMRQTIDLLGLEFRFGECRQEHARQDGDDGDDHQQFDQGEGGTGRGEGTRKDLITMRIS